MEGFYGRGPIDYGIISLAFLTFSRGHGRKLPTDCQASYGLMDNSISLLTVWS